MKINSKIGVRVGGGGIKKITLPEDKQTERQTDIFTCRETLLYLRLSILCPESTTAAIHEIQWLKDDIVFFSYRPTSQEKNQNIHFLNSY